MTKLNCLHASGAPYYWIVDPMERVVLVHRWTRDGYIHRPYGSSEVIRAEPFDAVERRVAVLFGDEPDVE